MTSHTVSVGCKNLCGIIFAVVLAVISLFISLTWAVTCGTEISFVLRFQFAQRIDAILSTRLWDGIFNTFFWIDVSGKTCGVVLMQTIKYLFDGAVLNVRMSDRSKGRIGGESERLKELKTELAVESKYTHVNLTAQVMRPQLDS